MPESQRKSERSIRTELSRSPAVGTVQAQRYNANLRRSPLLRLPAELRTMIYDYVFHGEGRIIHVHYVPHVHKGRNQRKGGFEREILHRKQNPWEWYLDNNKPRKRGRVTRLHRVCRQLYHDTVERVRQRTAWSFANTYAMERFVRKEQRMTLMQRRAVRTLYCRENLSKTMEQLFGNLEIVVWKDSKRLIRQDLRQDPTISRRDTKDNQDWTYRPWER